MLAQSPNKIELNGKALCLESSPEPVFVCDSQLRFETLSKQTFGYIKTPFTSVIVLKVNYKGISFRNEMLAVCLYFIDFKTLYVTDVMVVSRRLWGLNNDSFIRQTIKL